MLSDQQLAFILYNNRSVEGVSSNFFRRFGFDAYRLLKMESQMDSCSRSVYAGSQVEVERSALLPNAPDILYGPEDLIIYSDLVMQSFAEMHSPTMDASRAEKAWLLSRGIDEGIISDLMLGSLSYIVANTDQRGLDVLGISCHPALKNLLLDDVSGGGIVIPLFRKGLKNLTVRRISDVGKLKYTQSCPELDVWGLDGVDPNRPLWMTEGIFDMSAIRRMGEQAVSVSSAMWTAPQLLQILDTGVAEFKIFCDNDQAGLRAGFILQQLIRMQNRECRTFVSSSAKDPAEHFLQNVLGWGDVNEICITNDMISRAKDTVFNFTNYLRNRSF